MNKITAKERRWRFHRGAEYHRAMTKHSSHILEFARRGAQQRYDELVAEINSLVRHFPDLGAATTQLQPRKRRKMSAAARKAISDAQKARWAKQKTVCVRALSVRKAAFILRACDLPPSAATRIVRGPRV